MKQMSYVQEKPMKTCTHKWNKCRTSRKIMKLVDANETNVVRSEKRWNLKTQKKQILYVQKNGSDETCRRKWNKCRTSRKIMKLVDANETNVVCSEKRWNLKTQKKQISYVQKNGSDETCRRKWSKCRTSRKKRWKLVDTNEINVVRPEKWLNLLTQMKQMSYIQKNNET
jgi:hypothetical protein